MTLNLQTLYQMFNTGYARQQAERRYQLNMQRVTAVQHDFATDTYVVTLPGGRRVTVTDRDLAESGGTTIVATGGGGAGTVRLLPRAGATGGGYGRVQDQWGRRFLARGEAQMAGSIVAHEWRDAQGRFHREDGPAIIATNGTHYWLWHGMECDERAIMRPETIDLGSIRGASNIPYDLLRVYIERYVGADPDDGLRGDQRVMRDALAGQVADILNHDARFGTLACIRFMYDEPLTMVVVTNRTAEEDGSFKTYYLRVPPGMWSAQQAVAWTFRLEIGGYDPAIET